MRLPTAIERRWNCQGSKSSALTTDEFSPG